MQLKYENIYIINGKEISGTELDEKRKKEIAEELEIRAMKVFGYRPKGRLQKNKNR